MSAVPHKLRIGPHTYKVRLDKRGIMKDASCRGTCDTDELVIDVNGDLPPSAAAETLLHETIHACLAHITLDDDLEERIVLALSPVLLRTLRDNPKLVTFIQATG